MLCCFCCPAQTQYKAHTNLATPQIKESISFYFRNLYCFFFFTDFKYDTHTESADEEAIYTQCESRVAFTLIGFFSYCNKYRQHLVPFFWRECNWKGLLRADQRNGCSEELRLTPLISECFWSLRHTSAVLVEQLQQNKNLKEELKVSVLFAVWEFSPWTGLLQISAAIHTFLLILKFFCR